MSDTDHGAILLLGARSEIGLAVVTRLLTRQAAPVVLAGQQPGHHRRE